MNSFRLNFWNVLKKKLNYKNSKPYFYEREIWFCSIGHNIGAEENGKNEFFERPVLVVKKFNNELFLGVCLTSNTKTGKYYHWIKEEESNVILSQIRVFDAKRLIRKKVKINKFVF